MLQEDVSGESENSTDGYLLLIEEAVTYSRDGVYSRDDFTSNEKRSIRRKANKLVVVDGEVFTKKKGDSKLVKCITSRQEQVRIARSCHIDPTSGHLGIKKTYYRISERFSWYGMMNDVKKVILTCDECQRIKDKIVTTRPELHPVPVYSPWHHIGIDFVGPISPISRTGNRYILTISDYFSKWVGAFPLPTKEATGVASTLFKLFMTMGLPKILTTDQGSEFKNHLNEELMKGLKIKHHLITAYHPQANGLDERFNQTLQRMLIKYCYGSKDTWDEYLDSCVFAYNTSRQESSLHTPFEVMFGRKAVLPVDINENVPCTPNNNDDINKAVEILTDNRMHVLQEVKDNITKAQQKQKETYDARHSNPCKFLVGTEVLKKDFRRKKRKGGKLDPKWLGPFTIVKDLGKGFYSLKDGEKIIVKRVNGAHLKIYHSSQSQLKNITEESSIFTESSIDSPESKRMKLQEHTYPSLLEDSFPPLPPPIYLTQQPPVPKPRTIITTQQRPVPKPRTIRPVSKEIPSTSSTPDKPIDCRRPPVSKEILSNSSYSFECMTMLTSTMIVSAGYIPTFFPDNAKVPSPISKQDMKVTSVKDLAFKQRQERQQRVAVNLDEARICIDLDDVLSVSPILPTEDSFILLSGAWLTDTIIDEGQRLIKKKYRIDGLQNIILGQTMAFEVMKQREFVQVLNTGKGHWITISTVGCKSSEIEVFDSMHPVLTNHVQKQIAVLLCSKDRSITVKYKHCQLQRGGSDCGLFALAFASVIASGDHPSSYHFHQDCMRQHLHDCIAMGTFTPFPTKKIGRINRKTTRLIQKIEVWCSCRMPSVFSPEMVACQKCNEWYHLGLCVPDSARKLAKWICNNCC